MVWQFSKSSSNRSEGVVLILQLRRVMASQRFFFLIITRQFRSIFDFVAAQQTITHARDQQHK